MSRFWLILAIAVVVVVVLGGMRNDKTNTRQRQPEIQWVEKAR
jgi:hypothetical protein